MDRERDVGAVGTGRQHVGFDQAARRTPDSRWIQASMSSGSTRSPPRTKAFRRRTWWRSMMVRIEPPSAGGAARAANANGRR